MQQTPRIPTNVYDFELRQHDPDKTGKAREVIRSFLNTKYDIPRIRGNKKGGRLEFAMSASEEAELIEQLARRGYKKKDFDMKTSAEYPTVAAFYASFDHNL